MEEETTSFKRSTSLNKLWKNLVVFILSLLAFYLIALLIVPTNSHKVEDNSIVYWNIKEGLESIKTGKYEEAMAYFKDVSKGRYIPKLNYIYAYILHHKIVSTVIMLIILAVSCIASIYHNKFITYITNKYCNLKDNHKNNEENKSTGSNDASDKNSLTIICHVCSSEISKNAKSCPKCGEPFNNVSRFKHNKQIIVALVIIISSVGIYKIKQIKHKNLSKPAEQRIIFSFTNISHRGSNGSLCRTKCSEAYTNKIDSYLSNGYKIITSSQNEKSIDLTRYFRDQYLLFASPSDLSCTCVGTEYVIQK